jgi:hypothetical protein
MVDRLVDGAGGVREASYLLEEEEDSNNTMRRSNLRKMEMFFYEKCKYKILRL